MPWTPAGSIIGPASAVECAITASSAGTGTERRDRRPNQLSLATGRSERAAGGWAFCLAIGDDSAANRQAHFCPVPLQNEHFAQPRPLQAAHWTPPIDPVPLHWKHLNGLLPDP